MSDTMQAPPQSDLDQFTGASGDDNRRRWVLLAGLVGIIVIAAAAYFLFLSGGGEDDGLGLVTPGVVDEGNGNGQNEQNGGSGGNGEGTKLPEEFEGEVGQDPFKPLAAEAPVADSSGTSTGTQAGTGTATDTADDGSATATTISVEVASVDVKAAKATILVDGKSYTVKQGDVFPSATTGPFKAVGVGTTDSGEAFVKVEYGSDLPVILQEGKEVTFG